MQTQLVPLGSVTIGPQSWRDGTVRSIRRTERLLRQTRAGQPAASGRPRTVTFSPNRSSSETRAAEGSGPNHGKKSTRPQTSGVTFRSGSHRVPFPPSSLREQCAAASITVAREYMRKVREVEAQLRRQAARVTEEVTKLERERAHLDGTLRGITSSLSVNRRSAEGRRGRPARTEAERDGADFLLLREKRELLQVKLDLEKAARSALTQLQALGESGRRLQDGAAERARVLELLPHSGSAGGGRTPIHTDPTGPFTPDCKQLLESSSVTVNQSQLLRENIRQMLTTAVARQNTAHRSVNDGLIKKIAETVELQQNLTVMSAAARQAMFRKQREVNSIRHSYSSAQGPEYSGDILSREKLSRPLVQVYQRHPGTRLPEAAHLIQGSAVLRSCLKSSEGELARLQRAFLQLRDNLHGKRAAAQVDTAVVCMRRQQVDRRAVPFVLQQGAL